MALRCVDLARFGVVLIPPQSSNYRRLLPDLQQRVERPIAERPPLNSERIDPANRNRSALLVNRSSQPIVAGTLIWQFGPHGRSITRFGNELLLAPFEIPPDRITPMRYWMTILPGSKRYVHGSSVLGDNTDVRPPRPEEAWKGGVIQGVIRDAERLEEQQVTLTLDSVFFADGSFAGPDANGLWFSVISVVDAHLGAAGIAKSGRDRGAPAAAILESVERLLGPSIFQTPLPPRGIDDHEFTAALARRRVSASIARLRKFQGDTGTVSTLISWLQAPIPNFRRLG